MFCKVILTAPLCTVILCLMNSVNGVLSTTEGNCLDLAHCNLIKGDIARESEKYGSDPTKYYKDAENNVGIHIQSLRVGQESLRKYCVRAHAKCKDEVGEMAVTGLNFPPEYKTTCHYGSYSRTIFGCYNMENWPEKVLKALPEEMKNCKMDCPLQDDKTFTFSTGRTISRLNNNVDPKILKREKREKNSKRIIEWVYSVNESTFNSGSAANIGFDDTCPENKWVDVLDYVIANSSRASDFYLYFVTMICSEYNPKEGKNYSASDQIRSELWEPESKLLKKDWNVRCRDIPGAQDNSYVLGVNLVFDVYPGDTRKREVITHVNYMCAKDGNWHSETYKRHRGPGDRSLLCRTGAVCSIRTKADYIYSGFSKRKLLVDLAIGCCAPDPAHMSSFLHKPVTSSVSSSGFIDKINGRKVDYTKSGKSGVGKRSRYPKQFLNWTTCKDGYWVDMIDKADLVSTKDAYLDKVKMRCTKYLPQPEESHSIESGPENVMPSTTKKSPNAPCRNHSEVNEPYSYIVGVALFYAPIDTPVKANVLKHIDYVCANHKENGIWTFDTRNMGKPIDNELLCPMGSALCSFQIKYFIGPGKTGHFLNDINIGCCNGDASSIGPGAFVHQSTIDSYVYMRRPITRPVPYFISGFADYMNSTYWGVLDVCPDQTWVHKFQYFTSGEYMVNLPMICITYKTGIETTIESTAVEPLWKGGGLFPRATAKPCRDYPGAPDNSYIVGMSFSLVDFRGLGKALSNITYLCANDGLWNSADGKRVEPNPKVQMLCPLATAVCAVQTKSFSSGGIAFLTNLRIGCCDANMTYFEQFVHKGPDLDFFRNPEKSTIGFYGRFV